MRFVAGVEALLIVLVSIALLRSDRAGVPEARPTEATPTPGAAGDLPADALRSGDHAKQPTPVVEPESALAPAVSDKAVLFGRVHGARFGSLRVERSGGDGTAQAQVLFGQDVEDYAVPGLVSGRYRLRLSAANRRPIDAELEVPAGVDRVQRDFWLEKSWLLLVDLATPDGQPLMDAVRAQLRVAESMEPFVFATVEPPADCLPFVDDRGIRYGVGRWGRGAPAPDAAKRLPKTYVGYLDLPELEPLFVSVALGSTVLASERVAAGQEQWTLTVPLDRVQARLATLRLQVVDGDTGRPAPQAQVSLHAALWNASRWSCDAEGRLVVSHVPGVFQLAASAKGRVATWVTVTLHAGTSLDLGAIRVVRPASLRLRFTGIAPNADVNGWLASLAATPHASLRAGRQTLNGWQRVDGVWTGDVSPGRYLLRATAPGVGALVEIEARPRGEPIVVAMQPEAKLRVVPPGGDRAVELALSGASGREIHRQWITWSSPYDVSLPPGAYTAQITRLDGKREQRAVQVPLGGGVLDLRP